MQNRLELIELFLICRSDQSPNVNIPYPVENGGHRETHGAKLNLGAIIALGAFGGFVFLAAVITTIVVLVRRYIYHILFNMKHFGGIYVKAKNAGKYHSN